MTWSINLLAALACSLSGWLNAVVGHGRFAAFLLTAAMLNLALAVVQRTMS